MAKSTAAQPKKTSTYAIKMVNEGGSIKGQYDDNTGSGWSGGGVIIERDGQVVFDNTSELDASLAEFIAKEFGMRKVIVTKSYIEEWL